MKAKATKLGAINCSNLNYVTSRPLATEYNFHLDDEVTGTGDYRELFEILRDCGDNDVVRISIANFGGNLHTCISIVGAIRDSKATVIGSLTSIAYSAASIIWLACDVREVFEHAGLMAHDASGWSFGTFTQQLKQVEHNKKVLESLYWDIYEGFLTDDEIEGVLNGGDIWLEYEEIIERLKAPHEELEKAQEDARELLTEEALMKMTKKELVAMIRMGLEDLEE